MKEGKIKITRRILTKDDSSFYTENAVLIRFENAGTTRIWLDEQIVLDPGEAFIEGDNNGPGIDHRYEINFIGAPKAIAVDTPKIYSGNRLHVRLFKRIGNA